MNYYTRAILAFGIPFAVVAWAPVPHLHIPEKLDVLGMIRHINANNEGINSVNDKILKDMENINRQSDTTARIHNGLLTLQQGMSEQDASLADLNRLSSKQVELSSSLNRLAGILATDLRDVQQASASQFGSVQKLLETANSLSRLAQEVADVNGSIAGKLDRATQASGQVASNMP
ncbi:hypothetical protein [Effusibacillus pohliae]|uniref:hypothetical protein n=1 Tax=Effusibacillus pohliae TaxID=232270 RepID=UPI0003676050|nr:hypothetical protein [Effusibacillus pohliae]